MNRYMARSLPFVDGRIEAPIEVVQWLQTAEVGGLGVALDLALLADVEFVLAGCLPASVPMAPRC